MSRLVRAELVALRATPTAMRLLALALAVALFLTVTYVGVRDLEHLPAIDAERGVQTAVTGGFVVFFAGLILGTSGVPHGTALSTGRERRAAYVARVLVLAAFGAVAGLLTAALTTVTVLLLAGLGGGGMPSTGIVARTLATLPLYAALAAAAGAGLGAAVRSRPAAIGLGVLVVFVLDPALSDRSDAVDRLGPSGAAGGLIGIATPDGPSFALSLALLLGYAALALAAGALATARRDL
ncbi:MAG TPA: hypothetical protein VN238_03740 [Solirubrobacteraceae bacterium]|nr:hypothetical protein [Solirubrobacteraceae bacterium]